MSLKEEQTHSSRKRGRPAKQRSTLIREEFLTTPHTFAAALDEAIDTSSVETPTAFSEILQSLVGQDHSEVVRLAKHLQVAEVTVHRWMRGLSEPRLIHLQKMLDAFPTHYQELFQAIQQAFPGVLHSPISR